MSQRAERRAGALLPRVLIVDDEADLRELLELTLSRMGLAVDAACSVKDARTRLSTTSYQLCLTDMRLPDGEGLEVVRLIAETSPQTPIAVITAYGSTENAIAALKAGAFDYLAKPVSLEPLRALVKSALALPSQANEPGLAHSLLGSSQAIAHIHSMIDKVARSHAPVHITGESGSGKELAARLIHDSGAQRGSSFVPVNCGAIPETLMESEFFGYRKGAFTGADADREGFFQAANGGTLFLDEVADLPLAMQVKLLRAIQEKKVRKVGATAEEGVDVRVISATHQNLRQLVDQGRFRQDLYYRLNVIELRMPSLRECAEDIPLLADAILSRLASASGRGVPLLTREASSALRAYSFPGNVRELENVLERALALCAGEAIDAEDLQLSPAEAEPPPMDGEVRDLQAYLDQMEKQAITEALAKTRFNRTAAAKLLGVTFRSLRYRLQRLDIE